MMNKILLTLVFQYIFVEAYGKDSLRGSNEASVTYTKRFVQPSIDADQTKIRRDLELEDLLELSLWDYMDQVDKKYSETSQYSRFRSLVTAADRKDDLSELTGITLLAPIDDGISREIKDFLLEPQNKEILNEFVEYHIIPRVISFLSPEFEQTSTVTTFTLAGENMDISVNVKGVHFNQRSNAVAYALTNESILYKIDRLLIPPSMNSKIPEEVLMTNMKNTDNVFVADVNYEFPIAIPDDFWGEGNDGTDDAAEILSDIPSTVPSDSPSFIPSDTPSSSPSDFPSTSPSHVPSIYPSTAPSTIPSDIPSIFPVKAPAVIVPFVISEDSVVTAVTPSSSPSLMPSIVSSDIPSSFPITIPSSLPSNIPSSLPSNAPSSLPSNVPSSLPSYVPSSVPSDVPSTIPSVGPSTAVRDETTDLPGVFWDWFSPGGVKRNVSP